MKRVLLTGASGFIGRQAIDPLLKRGYEVHAISSHAQNSTNEVQWHCLDLLDRAACQSLMHGLRPTHCLHFAWYAQPGKYWAAPENLAWVEASLALARNFRDAGGKRLVVAGTCAEYAWGNEALYNETDAALQPATLYGVSKHALQQILEKFSETADISFAWGRIFSLYGPHEYRSRLVASVINALLDGQLAKCSDGEVIRDYLHVADVAEAFVALLDSPLTGPTNIGSGQGTPLKNLIELIGQEIGRPELIQRGALPTPASEPPTLIADISRLRLTGWVPQIPLAQGVPATIAWWKSQRLTQSG